MRLIIVRHGETPYNTARRITGQTDVLLNELGQKQAELVGAYLAQETIDVVVSSDLQRTRATARAIARGHDLFLQEDADLREIAMGEWEGLTYTEITERFADSQTRWQSDPTTYAIPGGGETVTQVQVRLARALTHWYEQYPDATVVWATHGGVIGILICHLLGIDIRRRWQFRHSNASIAEISFSPEHIIIERLNETGHLATIRHIEGAEA